LRSTDREVARGERGNRGKRTDRERQREQLVTIKSKEE